MMHFQDFQCDIDKLVDMYFNNSERLIEMYFVLSLIVCMHVCVCIVCMDSGWFVCDGWNRKGRPT